MGGEGGKGNWRADNGSATGARAGVGEESSGRGRGGGKSGHSHGAGGRKAADDQRGEGSSKRAAPDGDEGGSSGGGKRARVGKPGQCEHNRQRSQCRECGGGSICQHNRQRSTCRECGGGGASASTIGSGASARRARQTRTSRCRRILRSFECHPRFLLSEPIFHLGQSSLIAFHARLNDKHRIDREMFVSTHQGLDSVLLCYVYLTMTLAI